MFTNGLPIPQAQATADRLITITAAREQIGVSRSKLYQLLAESVLPQPVKIGRRNYFSEREVQAFIHSLLNGRAVSRNSCGLAEFAAEMRRPASVDDEAAVGSSRRNTKGGR